MRRYYTWRLSDMHRRAVAALPPHPGPGLDDAALVRDAAARAGGHATLVRAPAAVRASVPALQPASAGVARVERAVRAAFDPAGVFETGRFLDMSRAD